MKEGVVVDDGEERRENDVVVVMRLMVEGVMSFVWWRMRVRGGNDGGGSG